MGVLIIFVQMLLTVGSSVIVKKDILENGRQS